MFRTRFIEFHDFFPVKNYHWWLGILVSNIFVLLNNYYIKSLSLKIDFKVVLDYFINISLLKLQWLIKMKLMLFANGWCRQYWTFNMKLYFYMHTVLRFMQKIRDSVKHLWLYCRSKNFSLILVMLVGATVLNVSLTACASKFFCDVNGLASCVLKFICV